MLSIDFLMNNISCTCMFVDVNVKQRDIPKDFFGN